MATEYKLSHTAREVDNILAGALVKGAQTLTDAEKTQVKSNIGSDAFLPNVSATDNGKFLRVVDGKWTVVDLDVYCGEVL